ncbi:MAG: hypothetical protein AAFP97_00295 [Pseudomonadota bacterium]
MPHLVLTYSNLDSVAIKAFQDKSAKALAQMGFAPKSIKCYAIQTSHAHIAGEDDGSFAHLTLRMINKSDRTETVQRAWLDQLNQIASDHFPHNSTLTAEAVFLPPLYRSSTR